MDRRNDIRDWMNSDPWMNGFTSMFNDVLPQKQTLKNQTKTILFALTCPILTRRTSMSATITIL